MPRLVVMRRPGRVLLPLQMALRHILKVFDIIGVILVFYSL